MKFMNIKTIALVAVAGFGLTSCEDFLNKPTIDNYNANNYYSSDVECLSGTSYLYSSPWSDFTRPCIKVGEILSGNYYPGTNPYLDFTVNGSDPDIGSMSNSLWSVIAHCNTVYNYIKESDGPSQAAKNQTMGECLTWKAVAYFFLVRAFGEVPIIHDNSEELSSGSYSTVVKVKKADIYEYIIMTLEKAIEILPETPMQAGRIDKAGAEGLLAKVYLTKAGVTGTINTEDLTKAAEYARLCLAHTNHGLMEKYSDVFRLANNVNPECLISWRWNSNNNQWTDQSFMQSDYAPKGFSENGDTWGQWAGMSTDLQEAFGIKVLEQVPDVWLNNRDSRLKATMMLPGYVYEYFWTDKGGFDVLKFIYDDQYNPSVEIDGDTKKPWLVSPTGAWPVKHLFGDNADHTAGVGYPAGRMANSLATPLLRISDVMLILAEAKVI
ncbi:MAG: RagB/SusD family nutrient uptake outer membrane protein, partial [Prevotella sp.]|nr:RagB/SusD family nutrient uptake outer membrane protein [Prevotella sp.]